MFNIEKIDCFSRNRVDGEKSAAHIALSMCLYFNHMNPFAVKIAKCSSNLHFNKFIKNGIRTKCRRRISVRYSKSSYDVTFLVMFDFERDFFCAWKLIVFQKQSFNDKRISRNISPLKSKTSLFNSAAYSALNSRFHGCGLYQNSKNYMQPK